ncbi:MAG: hypothetical protein KG028_15255 [Actinobacteria bacterium]|jgi:hypothetical protein|nr:hypothetical protein [Actinomycetota bacterium]
MPSPALAALRRVRRVAAALVPVVAVLVLLTAEGESTVPAVLPVLLVAVTGAAAVGGAVAADRMLERRTPAATGAAALLRTHGLIQLAIADFPLLLAVALAYVVGPDWVVLVGAAAALAALLAGSATTARARRLESVWRLPAGTLTHGPADAAPDDDDHDKDAR